MNQQTTTTHPQREFRAVELLTGGEHINHQAHQDDDVLTWRVGHVAPYTDDNSVPMVALMLALPGGGEPVLMRERRGVTVPIATESEVASAEAEGNRFAVASALRQVADDIVNRRLPVPRYSFTVGGVLDSRGALEMWAEHLGVEIRMSGDIPVADKAAGGLTVHFQSAPEPAPQPQPEPDPETAEQEWLFTFGSGQQHDGRFVRISGTYDSARSRMNLVFGHAWCAQYDWQRFDEEGLPARVTELPESEWPPHFEVVEVPSQRSGE